MPYIIYNSIICYTYVSVVLATPDSPVGLVSVAERTYQRLLHLEDNLEANRMVLESISSINRLRRTSVQNENRVLVSLMDRGSYIDNVSIHSTRSENLLDADSPTHVRMA